MLVYILGSLSLISTIAIVAISVPLVQLLHYRSLVANMDVQSKVDEFILDAADCAVASLASQGIEGDNLVAKAETLTGTILEDKGIIVSKFLSDEVLTATVRRFVEMRGSTVVEVGDAL